MTIPCLRNSPSYNLQKKKMICKNLDYPLSILGMHVGGLKERLEIEFHDTKFDRKLCIYLWYKIIECEQAIKAIEIYSKERK